MKFARLRTALAALALLACSATARADLTDSLTKGTPQVKSIGALAFGPEGILFIGDPQGAAVFAVVTGDTKSSEAPAKDGLKVANINEKAASLLGIESGQLQVNALAVNPASSNAYLGVMRCNGHSD